MKVWIGVEFGGDWDIHGATSLKDLSEECGFSYRTALDKKSDDGFMIRSALKSWMVKEVNVKKIVGRGNVGNFKKN